MSQFQDVEWLQAIDILEEYFAESTSAPLQQEMVLIEEPYCDNVEISTQELPRCLVTVDFTGVPVDRVDEVADK